MSLEKLRKTREKLHKFVRRDQSLHNPLNNLVRSFEKWFSDEKEADQAKISAKHAKTKEEFYDQKKVYLRAKKSGNLNKRNAKKALRLFNKKWRKLKRAARF